MEDPNEKCAEMSIPILNEVVAVTGHSLVFIKSVEALGVHGNKATISWDILKVMLCTFNSTILVCRKSFCFCSSCNATALENSFKNIDDCTINLMLTLLGVILHSTTGF